MYSYNRNQTPTFAPNSSAHQFSAYPYGNAYPPAIPAPALCYGLQHHHHQGITHSPYEPTIPTGSSYDTYRDPLAEGPYTSPALLAARHATSLRPIYVNQHAASPRPFYVNQYVASAENGFGSSSVGNIHFAPAPASLSVGDDYEPAPLSTVASGIQQPAQHSEVHSTDTKEKSMDTDPDILAKNTIFAAYTRHNFKTRGFFGFIETLRTKGDDFGDILGRNKNGYTLLGQIVGYEIHFDGPCFEERGDKVRAELLKIYLKYLRKNPERQSRVAKSLMQTQGETYPKTPLAACLSLKAPVPKTLSALLNFIESERIADRINKFDHKKILLSPYFCSHPCISGVSNILIASAFHQREGDAVNSEYLNLMIQHFKCAIENGVLEESIFKDMLIITKEQIHRHFIGDASSLLELIDKALTGISSVTERPSPPAYIHPSVSRNRQGFLNGGHAATRNTTDRFKSAQRPTRMQNHL